MDRVHGPPIFTTPYRQRQLLRLIVGSHLRVTLLVIFWHQTWLTGTKINTVLFLF